MMTLANNLPFISEYYKPTTDQEKLIISMEDFDPVQLDKSISLISKVKETLVQSILKIHATMIENDFDGYLNNASLNNNSCERSFGMLDYINRTKANMNFLLKETRVMAKMNNFFGSYYRKSKEDQSSMWWKAEKIQESVLEIVKDCDSSEETLRRKISKEALKFQKQKLDVFNQKIDMLLKKLDQCIPSHPFQYQSMKMNYLNLNKDSNEVEYLKALLQLKKMQSPKLPSKAFTTYQNKKLLPIEELKQKYFNVL